MNNFKIGDVIYDDIGKDIIVDEQDGLFYIQTYDNRHNYHEPLKFEKDYLNNNFKLDIESIKRNNWNQQLKEIINE